MVNFKEEKGAIALLVIITVLFFISFLTATYVYIANKSATQMEASAEIRKIYAKDDANEIYNSYFGNNEENETNETTVIPIYTQEQLLKVGSDQCIQINELGGKYYYFLKNASYIFMNDIEIDDRDEIINIVKNANVEYNNHKCVLDGNNAKVEEYVNILKNLMEREIITKNDNLSIETVEKLYKICNKNGLSIDCFSVIIDSSGKEHIVYLYGPIYKETYKLDDGAQSFKARKTKIVAFNEMTDIDGMLIGDANQNGKIDSQDVEYIYYVMGKQYSALPYDTIIYATGWIDTYYLIIADLNNDGKCDGGDAAIIDDYLNNNLDISNFVIKYDITNSANEQELITYNY